MGRAMAGRGGDSIPKQSGSWAATLGAYRLLNNDRVEVAAIGQPVFAQSRATCAGRSVVLLLQDLSEMKPVYSISPTRLYQHSVLAVDGDERGELIGLMDQRWFDDPKAPPKQTRTQRRARWRRSCVWPEAVATIGGDSQVGRFVHVADREADDFAFFLACQRQDVGWLVRSQHDRYLITAGDGPQLTLRQTMAATPVAGGYTVSVQARPAVLKGPSSRQRPRAQPTRRARLVVRHRQVTVDRPRNDPRYDQPLTMYAVWAREVDPPDNIEPIDWLLLTSEPVVNLIDAMRIITWYRRRWLIEEFHKAQKTGCGLEQSQLRTAAAFQRLAAISAAVAVGLLQMRQAADDPQQAHQPAVQHFDPMWVLAVAMLAKTTPTTLTVADFHHTIARHGGWLARKHDGRPGFQALYHGWQRIADYVQGMQILANAPPEIKRYV